MGAIASQVSFDGKDVETTNLVLIINVYSFICIFIFIFMLFILKWNYFKASFFTTLLITLHIIISSILIQLNIISPIFLGGLMILGSNRTIQHIVIPFFSIATLLGFVEYMMYASDKPTNNTNRNKNIM